MDQEHTLASVTVIVFLTILGSRTSRENWRSIHENSCKIPNAAKQMPQLSSGFLVLWEFCWESMNYLNVFFFFNSIFFYSLLFYSILFYFVLALFGYSVATGSTWGWKVLEGEEEWGVNKRKQGSHEQRKRHKQVIKKWCQLWQQKFGRGKCNSTIPIHRRKQSKFLTPAQGWGVCSHLYHRWLNNK